MDGDLPPGAYEQLLTAALAQRIQAELTDLAALHPSEAADRLALHLGEMVRRAIESVPPNRRSDTASNIARDLGLALNADVQADLTPDLLTDDLQVLRSIGTVLPDGTFAITRGRSRRCSTPRCSPTPPANRA